MILDIMKYVCKCPAKDAESFAKGKVMFRAASISRCNNFDQRSHTQIARCWTSGLGIEAWG